MKLSDITFSVNDYDFDGYIITPGIFLNFGETKVRVANNLKEFKLVVERFKAMQDEIENNYPEC